MASWRSARSGRPRARGGQWQMAVVGPPSQPLRSGDFRHLLSRLGLTPGSSGVVDGFGARDAQRTAPGPVRVHSPLLAVVPRSRALHLAERRSTAVHGGGKYLGRKAFGQRGDDGCPRWSLVRCEPHWHRSAGGTSRSAWSMWAPQPAHVGRPHFEHRIAWHIPPRVSGRFHPGKQKLWAPSPTALGPAAPPL